MRSLRSRWKAVRAVVRSRVRSWRIAARNRSQASSCFYCGCGFTPSGARQRTVDHRSPSSGGGTNRLGNLVFACRSCNQRKANHAEEDFVASDWLARRREDVRRPPAT
jgi:5-methylcytosine-specific restriction endonuclease McrA